MLIFDAIHTVDFVINFIIRCEHKVCWIIKILYKIMPWINYQWHFASFHLVKYKELSNLINDIGVILDRDALLGESVWLVTERLLVWAPIPPNIRCG